ncbi:MAG TPA: TlpA family protein disulfide reductase [Deltaproteobacteria bacterium]|mgnify:CR=1 FL=1|nr:TlpA family protein disulfide reductase [Deltaproteobacteria bacterium]
MMHLRVVVLWACVLFFLFICPAAADVEASRNSVVGIDAPGVEQLTREENCPIFISIMTSRCGACRSELTAYQEMYEKYGDKGLGIFVVSIDFGTAEEIQRLVDQLGLTFPVYWGGEKVMKAFNISYVPYKIIVSKGRVLEKQIGGWKSTSEFEAKINELFEACER